MVMFSIFSTYRCLIIDTAYMPTGFSVLRSKTFFWNFTITNTIMMTMRLPGWRTRIAIDINCTPALRKSKTCSWPWSQCSWINNYLCNRCLSPLMLWVQISLFSRCTTLYIYGPCCTEIWNNVFPKKSYFSKVCLPEEVIFPEGLFTRRSHISRRFVYPKKKYDFLEKYDFFGWTQFHISLQQGPCIVYYTKITHTATTIFLQ
jgi:hypothetical protein